MEQPRKFKLIDGTFSATDARSVLTAIVSAKINFHSLKQFSETIRYGGDKSHSEQRIAELKKLHEELNRLLDEAAMHGLQVKINGSIEIELEPGKTETDKE
jgi:hypothetical protein